MVCRIVVWNRVVCRGDGVEWCTIGCILCIAIIVEYDHSEARASFSEVPSREMQTTFFHAAAGRDHAT